jgi:hypothetical protein
MRPKTTRLSLEYRYFVDSGFFLASEQPTDVVSVAKNLGCNGLQQKSEETAFPKSTKYRRTDKSGPYTHGAIHRINFSTFITPPGIFRKTMCETR